MSENFGDRPEKLIAAFKTLDSKKTGKVSTAMVMKLLTEKFDDKLTAEEKEEFLNEADDNGFIVYEPFVKNVVFGKVKL